MGAKDGKLLDGRKKFNLGGKSVRDKEWRENEEKKTEKEKTAIIPALQLAVSS